MIQVIYCITIQKEKEITRFLKSFDKFVTDSCGRPIDSTNRIGVILNGDEAGTISFVSVESTSSFCEMYRQWRRITREYELSMEYVRDDYVYLLAFHQLHSGPDYPYNQINIHNDVPRTRPARRRKRVDLKLRPASPRDYGTVDPGEISPAPDSPESKLAALIELLKTDEWLERWHKRTAQIHQIKNRCVCYTTRIDVEDAKAQAFILTIADALAQSELWSAADKFYDFRLTIDLTTTTPAPSFLLLNTYVMVDVNPSLFFYYMEPVLDGRVPMLLYNRFYSHLTAAQLATVWDELSPLY